MKTKIAILSLAFAVLLIQSCIPSLHPLYTKDKIVFLNQLVGVWEDEPADVEVNKRKTINGKERDITFTLHPDESSKVAIWDFRKKENGYLLIHQDDKGRKAAFEIFVVKLGDNYFMDFYLTDLPKEERPNCPDEHCMTYNNELAAYHVFPVHTFAKLIVIGDEVKIKMFDPDFLDKLFRQRQIRIKHEVIDDGYILTAQPEELQKFVEKYADHHEAYFRDVIVLNKKS